MSERPVDLVRAATARWGEHAVALRCADLLTGGCDDELTDALGGPAAGLADTVEYWPRVWAARGLRYAWSDGAAPAVVAALGDEAWRVREMAAKVALDRDLGSAADSLAELCADPVPRVRAASARALAAVGEAEHAEALRPLLDDPDAEVRRRAEQSLARLSTRLDRDLH